MFFLIRKRMKIIIINIKYIVNKMNEVNLQLIDFNEKFKNILYIQEYYDFVLEELHKIFIYKK
ncbi:MAG: hypothetical protein KatS3mg129_1031 [Leptospiraceae bacterium]|nr:MAG: hypothetical protein KatS3mg129_1031 [Leptospiraceae bacterium]